jgi:hypothetical protein
MPRLKSQTCGRCGKKLESGAWVRSSWNDNYYCTDLDACKQRAIKQRALPKDDDIECCPEDVARVQRVARTALSHVSNLIDNPGFEVSDWKEGT